jgi:class 3 adenylate cyclase/YHS domain-containing protein
MGNRREGFGKKTVLSSGENANIRLVMDESTGLTLAELSALSGEPMDEVRHWAELGLLPGEDGTLPRSYLHRTRLIRFVADRGIAPKELAEITAEQDLLAWFERDLPEIPEGPTYAFDELADLIDVSPELLGRVRTAAGLLDRRRADEVDREALKGVLVALEGGLPEEALLQLIRVYHDSLGRAADATVRIFHLYVHEVFRGAGLEGPALAEATRGVGDQVRHLVEPTISYFFRNAWRRAFDDDFVVHVREASTPVGSAAGEIQTTVVFVDLSSFTPLTEAMGDESAAAVVNRFSEIVRSAALAHRGQVVKQIGDAFMLVFSDARDAVACAIAMDEEVAAEPAFPAVRTGAHTGPVLYREGDYIGANVNLAARVAAAADRHQLLVTEAVIDAIDNIGGIDVTSIGARRLKGVAADVPLFEVRSTASSRQKIVDPVCGMELEEPAVMAQLTWQTHDFGFCSQTCLQRFVAAPETYHRTGPER